MIFLTSNLGGGEITELMTGGMGFVQPGHKPADALDGKVERTAQEAARRKFSPEFMNRLDKVVVFHPLRHGQLEQILDIELAMVQRRVLDAARGQFLFRVTPEARAFLLREGTDMKYGARHLKRAIERNIVYPLANLLATEQVKLGDVLCIDFDEYRQILLFEREGEGAVLPVPVPAAAAAASAHAAGAGGRAADVPSVAAAREVPASAPIPLAPVPAPSGRRKHES
jgi:ATP-dependent Clp protease ATP-binding subunit ClpA